MVLACTGGKARGEIAKMDSQTRCFHSRRGQIGHRSGISMGKFDMIRISFSGVSILADRVIDEKIVCVHFHLPHFAQFKKVVGAARSSSYPVSLFRRKGSTSLRDHEVLPDVGCCSVAARYCQRSIISHCQWRMPHVPDLRLIDSPP